MDELFRTSPDGAEVHALDENRSSVKELLNELRKRLGEGDTFGERSMRRLLHDYCLRFGVKIYGMRLDFALCPSCKLMSMTLDFLQLTLVPLLQSRQSQSKKAMIWCFLLMCHLSRILLLSACPSLSLSLVY